jgi:hypothetical protein
MFQLPLHSTHKAPYAETQQRAALGQDLQHLKKAQWIQVVSWVRLNSYAF